MKQRDGVERTLELERTKFSQTAKSKEELVNSASDLKASVSALSAAKQKLELQVESQTSRIESMASKLLTVDGSNTETASQSHMITSLPVFKNGAEIWICILLSDPGTDRCRGSQSGPNQNTDQNYELYI